VGGMGGARLQCTEIWGGNHAKKWDLASSWELYAGRKEGRFSSNLERGMGTKRELSEHDSDFRIGAEGCFTDQNFVAGRARVSQLGGGILRGLR